jgi:hypothetical protein
MGKPGGNFGSRSEYTEGINQSIATMGQEPEKFTSVG